MLSQGSVLGDHEKEGAQGKDIGGRSDGVTQDLLRGQVIGRTHQLIATGNLGAALYFGNTKITYFSAPINT